MTNAIDKKICGFVLILSGILFTVQGLAGLEPVKLSKIASSKPLIELNVNIPSAVIINHQKYIYLLDSQNSKILSFDPRFKLVNRFGTKGAGPGEFFLGYSLSHDKDDNIYVIDTMKKILQYNAEGTFIREKRFIGIPPLSKGFVLVPPYVAGIIMNMKIPGYDIVFFNQESKLPVKEASMTCSPNYSLRASGDMLIAPAVNYTGGHYFTDYCENKIVIGEGERFDVRLFDHSGKLLARVKKNSDPLEITSEERRCMVERLKLRLGGRFSTPSLEKLLRHYKKKNHIADLKLTQNNIFVFLVPSRITNASHLPAAVYDFKGQLIREVEFPGVPLRIGRDELIMRETEDVDGDEITRLVKYRYQLK